MIEDKTEAMITTVYPVANGNGASYIAMNLAYETREKNPHAKIAVVDFDFTSPFLGESFTDDNVHGIDNLIDKINGNFLDAELFQENMIPLRNDIALLKGTQMGRFNIVKQEHLTVIIEFLKELYDYVFIATNAEATDGGTPVGLFSAKNILIVGRYNYKNEQLANKAVQAISSLTSGADIGIVYNFYHSQNGIDFSERFSQWRVFGTIPYLPETVDNQNLTGKGLNIIKKKKDATQELYDTILSDFNI